MKQAKIDSDRWREEGSLARDLRTQEHSGDFLGFFCFIYLRLGNEEGNHPEYLQVYTTPHRSLFSLVKESGKGQPSKTKTSQKIATPVQPNATERIVDPSPPVLARAK